MMRDSLTLYQTGKTYNIEWVSVFRNAIKGQLYDYSNSYYKMNHSQWMQHSIASPGDPVMTSLSFLPGRKILYHGLTH